MKDLAIFKENICEQYTYLKTRKKSLPDEKNPETLPLSGQKIQYISFWRKTSKNKKYGVDAGIFHKHAITKL